MNGHWFLFMMIFIITRLLPSAIITSDTKRLTTVFYMQLYVPKPWFYYFRSFFIDLLLFSITDDIKNNIWLNTNRKLFFYT